MNLRRRSFCSVGASAVSSQLLIGKASAQNKITVTGHLTTQANTDVSGLDFRLSNTERRGRTQISVDSDGELTTTISEPGTFRVTVFDYSSDINRLPAVYSFSDIAIGEDGDIGEFTLPRAYQTDIQCLDTDGNPIEDFPANFRAPNGTGMSPGTFTTTADGYVKYTAADQTGVELVDTVDIEVQLPDNPDVNEQLRTVAVSDSSEIGVTVSNPRRFTGEHGSFPEDVGLLALGGIVTGTGYVAWRWRSRWQASTHQSTETETDHAGSSEQSDVERNDEVITDAAADEHLPDTIEDISGVGQSKADTLRAGGYDSVSKIMAASQKELSEIDGIGNALAGRIKTETDNTDSSTASASEISEQRFQACQSAAETALETAVTAESNGELSDAVDAYSEAISEYQTALDLLDAGDAKKRTEIEQAIESARADLETITTLQKHQTKLIEALQPAERSFQEAVAASIQADQTVARIRFRQARDAFDDARKTIADSKDNLLSKPVEVSVNPGRELSSTILGELPAISEAAAALADAGIETITDLDSSDESPWTPAAVEELVADDTIEEDIVATLTLLSWWHGDGSYEFDTAEAIEMRHQQADYGFDHTS